MPNRKGGWERLQDSADKKRKEGKLLQKTHKLTKFFGSDDTHSDDAQPEPADDVPLERENSANTESTSAVRNDSLRTPDSALSGGAGTIRTDVGVFTDITDQLRDLCISVGGAKHFRNLADSYPETMRSYPKGPRYLSASVFQRVLPNGEITHRDWLVYSPAKAAVLCFPCVLFSSDRSGNLCGSGLTDWKNATRLLKSHESSKKHIEAVIAYCRRSDTAGRIDAQLQLNITEQGNYWKDVLKRYVATIVFLCERGLPLRGADENVGSNKNGNYFGVLEVIAQFDPFLPQHIQKRANRGRGHTSYLSSTICEELISLMGKRVLGRIKDEIKRSRYFSVSVDSTPDLTHTDQLTIIIRSVNMDTYEPVERFLTFIPISSHTGENLANTLLAYLAELDINFNHCRGQTYDNASNMSGCFNGMQQKLNKVNSLVDFNSLGGSICS